MGAATAPHPLPCRFRAQITPRSVTAGSRPAASGQRPSFRLYVRRPSVVPMPTALVLCHVVLCTDHPSIQQPATSGPRFVPMCVAPKARTRGDSEQANTFPGPVATGISASFPRPQAPPIALCAKGGTYSRNSRWTDTPVMGAVGRGGLRTSAPGEGQSASYDRGLSEPITLPRRR